MDRFFRGFIAGMIGGVVMNAWSFFSYHVLHFNTLRFVDWVGEMLYGHIPESFIETVYALFIHLIWAGFLSLLFAYMIPYTTSRAYYIKAVLYAFISGFVIYAIPRLFKTPNLTEAPVNTVISNHIGGILWAITMVYFLRRLDVTPREKL